MDTFSFIRWSKELARHQWLALLVVGGDGTVRLIAQHLFHSNLREHFRLLVVPAGSGNGFALHMKYHKLWYHLPSLLPGLVPVSVDAGIVNCKELFLNVCGVGLDAQIAQGATGGGRLLRYVRGTLRQALAYNGITAQITTSSTQLEGKWLLITVANGSQWGNNFYITKNASISDGMLNLLAVPCGGFASKWRLLCHALSGRLLPTTPHTTITINLSTDLTFHADGEPITHRGTLHIECVPQAFTFLVAPWCASEL